MKNEELTTDVNLPAQLKAGFHAFNPNGTVQQMGDLRYKDPVLSSYATRIGEIACKNRVYGNDIQACINGSERYLRGLREQEVAR